MQHLVTMLALLSFHIGSSISYYIYSTHEAADAWGYYYDPANTHLKPFSVGSVATYKVVHFLKWGWSASYLDCYLIFQSLGFLGLIILARTFEEVQAKIEVPQRDGYLALLFLPSVNFWSSAIGKDAPLFFAIALAVWSMLSLGQRFLYFCVALGVMVLFRAHIALLVTSALAAAAFFEGRMGPGRKLGLLTVAVVGIFLVLGPAQRTINFDATSIGTYVEQQQSLYATAGGTTTIVHASLPFRIISLLFRPFFFDAHGLLGLIASLENVGVVIGFFYVLRRWRDVAKLARRVLFVRFVLIAAASLLFSLALVYYNVGLGLRERVMAYPMLFSVLVAVWAYRRKVAVPGRPAARSGQLLQASRKKPVPEL